MARNRVSTFLYGRNEPMYTRSVPRRGSRANASSSGIPADGAALAITRTSRFVRRRARI